MPTALRKCKVCGVEYPYCKTIVKDGVFRYQDVACCPEHGSIYLAQIIESRRANPAVDSGDENIESATKSSIIINEPDCNLSPCIECDDEDDDDLFYDDEDEMEDDEDDE